MVTVPSEEYAEDFGSLLPRIRVPPPGDASRQIAEVLRKYEAPTHTTICLGDIPVCWKRARGANVEDADGNILIDMTGGFGVANSGYCHPKITDAVIKQAQMMTHTPGYIATHPQRAELAEKIAGLVPLPLKKTHFMSSGSEAIETAFKLSRESTGFAELIAFEGAFHGKMYGSLTLTSRRSYRKHLRPLVPGVIHVPFPYAYRWSLGDPEKCGEFCLNYLDHVLSDPTSGATEVAAVITETVQAHEGWIVPPKGFIRGLRKICSERNVLLILDEIVTGFGRAGKMFYFEHENAVPDLLVCGKGLASGFPISATVMTDKIADSVGWGSGAYTSTFSGNPLCCAAALANIEVIREENLPEKAARLGTDFMNAMKDIQKECPIVGDVRGIGLMIGIEFVKDPMTKEPARDETKKIIDLSMKRGLMLQTPGGKFSNVIKLSPPLVITEQQLNEAAEILGDSIKKVEREQG